MDTPEAMAVAAALEEVRRVSGGRVFAVVIPRGVPVEALAELKRDVDAKLEELVALRDAGPALPPNWKAAGPGHCRSCGAPITWAESLAGKRAPFDLDGTSHFASCPQAGTWRKGRGPRS